MQTAALHRRRCQRRQDRRTPHPRNPEASAADSADQPAIGERRKRTKGRGERGERGERRTATYSAPWRERVSLGRSVPNDLCKYPPRAKGCRFRMCSRSGDSGCSTESLASALTVSVRLMLAHRFGNDESQGAPSLSANQTLPLLSKHPPKTSFSVGVAGPRRAEELTEGGRRPCQSSAMEFFLCICPALIPVFR